MDRKTKWRIFLSCVGFLVCIYGLASLDQGTRKKVEEQVMAKDVPSDDETTATPKIMYLTFDDGPSANTEAVLDILDKYKIKATFFVTGENPEYASMIKETFTRGHALGIHTYSHEYSKIYTSTEAYFEDMQKVSDLIKQETGQEVHIMRFPGGSSNTISRNYGNGIMSTLVKEIEEKGYQYYDWNAHNGDGDPGISASALYQKTMKDIKGKDEVMLLMHDGSGNKHTVESLDDVLKELVDQGWEFRTINEQETSVFHHHVAN